MPPPVPVADFSSFDAAKNAAKELMLPYGYRPLNGRWYVGQPESLRRMGVQRILTPF